MTESMVEYEPIVEILNDIFGEYKFHNENSGQISFSCPVCSYEIKGLDHLDGKGNLEINYHSEVYKCWSCCDSHGTRGHLHFLIKKYGSIKQLKKYELLMPEPTEEQQKKYAKVRLPKEFHLFRTVSAGLKMTPQYKRAYNYLKQRNVNDEMIDRFNMGFCYEGEYANRIIIPSFDSEGNLTYFTARSYDTNPKLKYKNPEAQKEVIIYNEHLIDWDLPVYIVEGPFDSIFLPNAIPMLGKNMSEMLFNTLYERAKKIIVVLDGDAWINSQKIYDKLNGGKLFGKIWITKLPIDKDIADLQGNLADYPPFQID
jgi:DNA primase